jgi:hypothetical protein
MFKQKKHHQYVNSYFKPITSMKLNKIISKAKDDNNHHNNKMSDSEGLSKAYNSPNSIYVDGNRMYISGTHTPKDVYDWKLIPLGLVKYSERYGQAEAALKDNPQITEVIGHSLGSSVAAELNKQYDNKFNARYYGSPFVDFSFSRDPKNQRYRHPGDIVSMFDTGAVNEDEATNYQLINPHSYEGFPDYSNDKDDPNNNNNN